MLLVWSNLVRCPREDKWVAQDLAVSAAAVPIFVCADAAVAEVAAAWVGWRWAADAAVEEAANAACPASGISPWSKLMPGAVLAVPADAVAQGAVSKNCFGVEEIARPTFLRR